MGRKLDYEDFVRHQELPRWANDDPRRSNLVRRRCATTKDVAPWVRETHERNRQNGPVGHRQRPEEPSMMSIKSIQPTFPEIAAYAALTHIGVACALLDRQIEAQAFPEEGGCRESAQKLAAGNEGLNYCKMGQAGMALT